jgi:hypothetical protein
MENNDSDDDKELMEVPKKATFCFSLPNVKELDVADHVMWTDWAELLITWIEIWQLDQVHFINSHQLERKVGNNPDKPEGYKEFCNEEFPDSKVFAVGEPASKELEAIGVSHMPLPHPRDELNPSDRDLVHEILIKGRQYLTEYFEAIGPMYENLH